jgi:hypothetical protein
MGQTMEDQAGPRELAQFDPFPNSQAATGSGPSPQADPPPQAKERLGEQANGAIS